MAVTNAYKNVDEVLVVRCYSNSKLDQFLRIDEYPDIVPPFSS